jgi:uncharacterized membrane protein YsdA (DUF1294 family)/cold shock CspA family protein
MPEDSRTKLTGKIIEWDALKGYGYVQGPQGRIFLHRRDFVERHKRPAIGDDVGFMLGQDSKGRPCATNASHLNDGGRITIAAWIIVVALLVLPSLSLLHWAVDLRWAGLYLLGWSLISFRCYAKDKRKAKEKGWRISESTLHLVALLGGWPGAFLAQQHFRHKVSKPGFQLTFWLIVLAYQFAALDSLQNWQLSKQVWNHVPKTEMHRH